MKPLQLKMANLSSIVLFAWEQEEVIEENTKEKGNAGTSVSLGKIEKQDLFFSLVLCTKMLVDY